MSIILEFLGNGKLRFTWSLINVILIFYYLWGLAYRATYLVLEKNIFNNLAFTVLDIIFYFVFL